MTKLKSKKHVPLKKNRIIRHLAKPNSYKEGLLEVGKQEDKYNALFEEKLSQQYKEFRSIKEHHIQMKKFIQIIGVLITIVFIALLLLTFR